MTMSGAPTDTGGVDVLLLPRREDRAADEPGIVGGASEADPNDDVRQARPEREDEDHGQQDAGHSHPQIGKAHDRHVDPRP